MTLQELLDAITGRIIVSCQADHGHPLRDPATIARMAAAAEAGGAAAIRCGGVGGIADIAAVTATVTVPVIGLTKINYPGVFITPTVADAVAILTAGARVVAADATHRPRPSRDTFADIVHAVHHPADHPPALVMADVATVAEGLAAARAGADLIATTLAGYTGDGPPDTDPDLDLVSALRDAVPGVPIVAEGRYHTPDQAAAALDAGATAVVVGTAITDPAWITGQFAAALPGTTPCGPRSPAGPAPNHAGPARQTGPQQRRNGHPATPNGTPD